MGVEQPAQAVILVGGLGTRLGARTANMPKPLLGVGGRPFLAHLIEEVARARPAQGSPARPLSG